MLTDNEALDDKIVRDAAAKLLGYRDWDEATDYRTTGKEDAKRELVVDHLSNFRQSIRTTDAARIAELTADLEWYADQFCEHGKYSEVCGRLGPDYCSGCRARTTLRSSPEND